MAESNGFNEEQMIEIREAFSLFDCDGDGQLDTTDLGQFLRSLGRNPTEAQIKTFSTEHPSGHLDLSDCLTLLGRIPAPDATALEQDLRAAFRVFDKDGSGKIPAGELKHIVTSLGERMTEGEAEEMLRVADPAGSGIVDYERFIRTLLSA